MKPSFIPTRSRLKKLVLIHDPRKDRVSDAETAEFRWITFIVSFAVIYLLCDASITIDGICIKDKLILMKKTGSGGWISSNER